MTPNALLTVPVGVVVERHKATSPWVDFIWRPTTVLSGVPSAAPWTPLAATGDTMTFYAGAAAIALHRTETANYIGNLRSGAPQLWVVLRPTNGEPPYEVLAVTADPAEGEAFTEAGNDPAMRELITDRRIAGLRERAARFVAEVGSTR